MMLGSSHISPSPAYLPSRVTSAFLVLLCLLYLFTPYFLSHSHPPDPRAGEIICRTCAVVIGERCIDDGAEWRTFVDDSSNGRADPNRCGEVLHYYYDTRRIVCAYCTAVYSTHAEQYERCDFCVLCTAQHFELLPRYDMVSGVLLYYLYQVMQQQQ